MAQAFSRNSRNIGQNRYSVDTAVINNGRYSIGTAGILARTDTQLIQVQQL
jgi:hypothetical protein